MKKYITLLIVMLAMGWWWSCSSYKSIAFVIALRPLVLSLLICVCWATDSLLKRMAILFAAIVATEVLSNVVYGLQAGFSYILSDGETQAWLVYSLAIQIVVAVSAAVCLEIAVKMRVMNGRQNPAKPDKGSPGERIGT
jgi:hypothetical protein